MHACNDSNGCSVTSLICGALNCYKSCVDTSFVFFAAVRPPGHHLGSWGAAQTAPYALTDEDIAYALCTRVVVSILTDLFIDACRNPSFVAARNELVFCFLLGIGILSECTSSAFLLYAFFWSSLFAEPEVKASVSSITSPLVPPMHVITTPARVRRTKESSGRIPRANTALNDLAMFGLQRTMQLGSKLSVAHRCNVYGFTKCASVSSFVFCW